MILGLTYGPPIDMWSFACILAELYTGVPIFPGENELDQLEQNKHSNQALNDFG